MPQPATPSEEDYRNNLRKRVTSALLGFALTVGLILGGPWTFLVWCSLVSLLGLLEFYHIVRLPRGKPEQYPAYVAFAIIWLAAVGLVLGWPIYWVGGPLLLMLPAASIVMLYRKRITHQHQRLATLTLGLVYVQLPFVLLWLFTLSGEGLKGYHLDGYHYGVPLGTLLLFFANDIAAFFGGRFMGRRKLFPRHSPGKSWEGFVAGLLGALAFGALQEVLWPQPWGFSWLVAAVIVAVVGTWGDLVESMLKRSAKMKDSGSLLPGHGGLLDRFDGLLLAMPVLLVYQQVTLAII